MHPIVWVALFAITYSFAAVAALAMLGPKIGILPKMTWRSTDNTGEIVATPSTSAECRFSAPGSRMLTTLVGAALVPLVLYIANLLLRTRFLRIFTVGADFAVALIIFDAAVVLAPGDFVELVRDVRLQMDIVPIFLGLMFSGILVWILSVVWGELTLAELNTLSSIPSGNPSLRSLSRFRAVRLYGSIFLIIGLWFAHVAVFLIETSSAQPVTS